MIILRTGPEGCVLDMRPIVGITAYPTQARYSHWDLEAVLIPSRYPGAVERSGGRPLLIPPTTLGVSETLDALDAIVFTGGPDLNPLLYGDTVHSETGQIDQLRDEAESALMRAALERDMPLLGICRGAQLLNVTLGGDLHQHLPDLAGTIDHIHPLPGHFTEHDIATVAGSRLARIIGPRETVKSRHHQGIRRPGNQLNGAAIAPDGLIEAIEAPAHRFVVGVLWHPESSPDLLLLRHLVTEAGRYRQDNQHRPQFGLGTSGPSTVQPSPDRTSA